MKIRRYRHRLTKTTKGSVWAIYTTILLILAVILPVNSWLNSEETVVLASTSVQETPESVRQSISPTPEPVVENEIYKDLIFDAFGEDGEVAYAIAKAESTLNPDKCHIDEKEYSCGLFQINLRAHFDKVPGDDFEEKAEFLKNPKNNVLIAKFLHGSSGFRPWSVFTNGSYLRFLPDAQSTD